MKKILFSLFAVMLFCASYAQTAFHQTTTNTTGAFTGTASDTMTLTLTQPYQVVSVQPVLTKVSGTIAGKTYLQLSINGTNYVSTDSLTNTDVTTNTIVWNKQTACRYFRILVVGTGTMAGTASAKLNAK